MNFENYQLKPFLLKAIEELGFEEPTEIQQQVIPFVQQKKSVIGQSQTGSGKSHSFLLPILNEIDPQKDEVQTVITSPSRELAEQLYQSALQLAKFSPAEIRIANYVGGTDKKRQISKLQHKQPHVVIGTPGRILDLVNEQALKVYTANTLVIDEADMTLDLGFLYDVDQIAGRLPAELQMLVFSATIPVKLQPFLKKYMANPETVRLEPKNVIAPSIENLLLATRGEEKMEVLAEVLSLGQPYFALIFANTKQKVNEIAEGLKEKGFDCAVLHGDIPARERKRLMRRVHQLEFQFLVATDLAARGIDIQGVSHVINYEIPSETEFFIHRIGRTGRKNLKGTAITFYGPEEENAVVALEQKGIIFQPVRLKNGELVEVVDRKKRENRSEEKREETDHRIKGMVRKAKKNVKPGYKRKLNEQIRRQNQQKKKNQDRRKK